MTTEIIYNGGMYDIRIDGIWVDTATTYHAAEQIIASIREAEHSWVMGGMDATNDRAPLGNICQSCGHVSLTWFCPKCNDDMIEASMPQQRPLLAQCAALLDSLLGGPVVGGGIIDEMRRVRAALRSEGW